MGVASMTCWMVSDWGLEQEELNFEWRSGDGVEASVQSEKQEGTGRIADRIFTFRWLINRDSPAWLMDC